MIRQYVDHEKPIQDIENTNSHVRRKGDVAYHVFTESSARLFTFHLDLHLETVLNQKTSR